MKCKTHPKYRALRRPTADCGKCRLMFRVRRVLKFLGFSVEEAKPRTRKSVIVIADAAEVEKRLAVCRAPEPLIDPAEEHQKPPQV